MSRDFEGTPNRDFKPSPNRDRIGRGGTDLSDFFFHAGERNADTAFQFGLEALFPFPNYASTDPIFQHPAFGSIPFDTLAEQLATPIAVGDFFRMTLLVEGICELYNPQEVVDLQSITWNNNGSPRTSYVLRRNSLAGLSLEGFAFKPLVDTLQAEPLIGQDIVAAFVSGTLLLVNPTDGIGVTGLVHWRKQIVTTMRATAARPTGYADANGARAQSVAAKYVFEGDESFITTLARAGRRNVAGYNTTSALVPSRNIIHTPDFTSPPVQSSASMFLGLIIGWEKTALTDFQSVQYTDIIPPSPV